MKGLLRSTAKNLREGRKNTGKYAGNAKGGNERGEGMRITKDTWFSPNLTSYHNYLPSSKLKKREWT